MGDAFRAVCGAVRTEGGEVCEGEKEAAGVKDWLFE